MIKGEAYLNSPQKRAVDIVEISLITPLAVVAVGVAALAIKIEDGGSISYTQERVGKGGKHFKLYKLRTMESSSQEYVFPKLSNDERVTRVGRIIRPPAIDELPQVLVNMLFRGDMSLFGVRALPVAQYEELLRLPFTHPDLFPPELVNTWKKAYECAPPGGLSLAIARGRSSLNLDLAGLKKKMEYDIEYIQNASFLYDLWVLKETISSFLSGKGAW